MTHCLVSLRCFTLNFTSFYVKAALRFLCAVRTWELVIISTAHCSCQSIPRCSSCVKSAIKRIYWGMTSGSFSDSASCLVQQQIQFMRQRYHLEVCFHEVPLVMSPVMQAMGWQNVHILVLLHAYEYSKKAVQELTGYQKGYPSLCLRPPPRAPLPSCWLRSFAVESGLGSVYLPFELELLTLRFSADYLQY